MIEKEKRHQLFENDDIVLEQRGNHYYLSLFDKDGKFQREVNITVKDLFDFAKAVNFTIADHPAAVPLKRLHAVRGQPHDRKSCKAEIPEFGLNDLLGIRSSHLCL